MRSTALFASDPIARAVTPQQERPAPEAFAAKNAGAEIFLREKATGLAMLAVKPGRVVLTITGTIPSEHIVGILSDANIAARLGSDAFNALIDISAFTGSIDWSDIQKVVDVMPKGDSRGNKNAYVVRNNFFMMVAKITAAFFKQTECAAFLTESDARHWLEWD